MKDIDYRKSLTLFQFFITVAGSLAALLLLSISGHAQSLHEDRIYSVSKALADEDGNGEIDLLNQRVTLAGRASVDNLVYNDRLLSVYIQDDKAGIQVFSGELQADIQRGDSIIVRGTVELYYDKPEIVADTLIIVDTDPSIPTPKTLAEVVKDPEAYLGMLTQGRAVVSQKSASSGYRGLTMTVSDTSEHILELYVSQSQTLKDEFNLEVFSIGDEIDITGVVGKFSFQSNDEVVYQVMPRTPEDVKTTGFPKVYLTYVALGGGIGFTFVLGWIIVLRKQVKSKTSELSKALEEKEILMQEIHHRVKNNLAKISGLLDLQISTADHPAVEESLSNSKSRINSMALIHDKLCHTQHYKAVRLDIYLKELITSIHDTYSGELDSITLHFDLEPIELSVDKVVVCGLLVNELIVNAFKYAFDENEAGKLTVTLAKNNSEITLSIADNGPGLPQDFDSLVGTGLGSVLIQNFAKQLEAEMTPKSNENGATFIFKFHP